MLKPLLILALLPTLAHARIGETPEECAKRYGEPFERLGGNASALHSFIKGGVKTTCYFTDAKCVAITFQPVAPVRADFQDTPENLPIFTDSLTRILLEANKGNTEWAAGPEKNGVTYFTAKDGSRRAFSCGTNVSIQITVNIEARKKLVDPVTLKETIEGF